MLFWKALENNYISFPVNRLAAFRGAEGVNSKLMFACPVYFTILVFKPHVVVCNITVS